MKKPINIVFLDIDNVLNYGLFKRGASEESMFGFDDKLLSNLKTIVTSVPDTYIVVSSSWRVIKEMPLDPSKDWRVELESRLGMPGIVIDTVGIKHEFPNIILELKNDLCGFDSTPGSGRGEDIADWLNSHKNVKNFVILDDNMSCGTIPNVFFNNFVNCDKHEVGEGLSERNAKEAIWILNGMEHRMNVNTWFTSDTHFYHANIIKYCNRPFADVEEMNKALVDNWNSIVGNDDIVWHLGDFALGKKENVLEILPKLNGKINLVMGNHDHHKLNFYYDAGFHRVYDRKVIINDFVILSHAPLMFLNDNCPFYNVFGHVHDSALHQTWTKSSCCVCVERHDYKPVSWEEIQAKYNELNNK